MKYRFLFKSNVLFHSTSYFMLRLATGSMMCYLHGWSKLTGDPDRWYRLGTSLTQWIGIDALATPLGFMAAFAESIAALFLAVGFMTRHMAFLMFFTMLVASTKKITQAGIGGAELALLYLFLSLFIFFNGGGKYSLDHLFFKKK